MELLSTLSKNIENSHNLEDNQNHLLIINIALSLSNELKELKCQLTTINDVNTSLKEEVDELKSEISDLTNEVNNFRNNPNLKMNKNRFIFKKETLKLDKEFLLRILKYNDHRTELELFKEYYLNGDECCPIQVVSERKIRLFTKNGWILDRNGYKMEEILCSNIYRTLIGVNTLENIQNGDTFVQNQTYLNKLLTDKIYRRNLYNRIRNHLMDLDI